MKTPRAGIRDTTPDEKRDAMRGAAGSLAASKRVFSWRFPNF